MSGQSKQGAPPRKPLPDTTGMTDAEFCDAIAESVGAELEDVVRTLGQVREHLGKHGANASMAREIMLKMS